MLKQIVFAALLCSSLILAKAQKSTYFSIPKAYTVKFDNQIGPYNPKLTHLEAPTPGGDSYRSFLLRQKAKSRKLYPRRPNAIISTRSSSSTNDSIKLEKLKGFPSYNQDFFGNGVQLDTIGPGTPSDHTIAVSNDGILLMGKNTTIWGYDLNEDTLLFSTYFPNTNGFYESGDKGFSYFQDSTLVQPFDPKLLYDPVEDRFVLVFLSGRDSNDTEIVVCFSQSNYPNLDTEWEAYRLTGNPFGGGIWSDYPSISLANGELFITMNLIIQGQPWETGFDQTVIWQLDKQAGYNGAATMSSRLWSDIKFDGKPLRNLDPVEGGKGLNGPPYYFISNRNFDIQNDSFWLVSIDDVASNPNAQLTVKPIIASQNYGVPPTVMQPQGHTFQTNDSRVLGSFLQDGQIQFVGNTVNFATGLGAYYHGIIDNPTAAAPTADLRIMAGPDSLEYGYPNIIQIGATSSNDAAIGYNTSGSGAFAGYATIVYDETADEYSNPLQVINGTDVVDRLSFGATGQFYERWGDYFGIQRVYNDTNKYWTVGYQGVPFESARNYMAEIKVENLTNDTAYTSGNGSGASTAATQIQDKPTPSRLFPNPATDKVVVEFTMTKTDKISAAIYDLNGRMVIKLLEDQAKAGRNQFEFSSSNLTSGIYILKIESANEILTTAKFTRR